MLIEVLGTGCPKCNKLEEMAKQAADRLGVSYRIEHVHDIMAMVERGVMAPPALVIDGNVVVSDLRELDYVPMGNRFLVYALYPGANVSVRLQWGPKNTVMMTLGHSILNRTCKTHLGELAARYGGGGRRGASSIPLIDENPELEIQMIIGELKANG